MMCKYAVPALRAGIASDGLKGLLYTSNDDGPVGRRLDGLFDAHGWLRKARTFPENPLPGLNVRYWGRSWRCLVAEARWSRKTWRRERRVNNQECLGRS